MGGFFLNLMKVQSFISLAEGKLSCLAQTKEKYGCSVFFTLAQVMIIQVGFSPPLSLRISFCFQYEHME